MDLPKDFQADPALLEALGQCANLLWELRLSLMKVKVKKR